MEKWSRTGEIKSTHRSFRHRKPSKEQSMEQGTEGTQVPGMAAPASAQAPAAPAAGAEMVEKKRLDGALQKIEELTLVNRTLTEQLNAIKGEKVSLMAEYGQKETA